jgi:hypothetical protein
VTTSHLGAIAISDELPVARDRRAATLNALAAGFRIPRIEIPIEPEPQAAIVEANVPVTYIQPPAEEPVVQDLPQQEIPVQLTTVVQPTNAATVEANTPATLNMLPSTAPETAPPPHGSFQTVAEPQPRAEPLQTQIISNPLRRAADAFSSRRNPLRSAD